MKLLPRIVWVVAISVLGPAGLRAEGPIPDKAVAIDIPSQALGEALAELGKQTGLQVVLYSSVGKGATTERLTGRFTAEAALEMLLANTGLRYEYLDSGTVAVLGKDEPGAGVVARNERARVAEGEDSAVTPGKGDGQEEEQGQHPESTEEGHLGGLTLEEIVVTGTHIRGTEALVGSEVVIVSRDYIEKSGQSTLQDVLNTLPQAAPGPRDLAPSGGDPRIKSNFGHASGINLRGLGAGATLVLVDGRRQASSGLDGEFVDISNIPLSAVERVEIVPDGASAVYGSDAIAGVVNIILRKNFTGNESRVRFSTKAGDGNEWSATQLFGKGWGTGNITVGLDYLKRYTLWGEDRSFSANGDLRRFGGGNYNSNASNPGNILDNNTFEPAFAIPRGQSGEGLTPGQLISVLPDQSNANYQNFQAGSVLVSGDRSESVFLTLSQRLNERMEVNATARFNNRPLSWTLPPGSAYPTVTPRNPFYVDAFGDQSAYTIAYDLGNDLQLPEYGSTKTYDSSIGLTAKVANDWTLTSTLSYSRQMMRNVRGEPDFAILDEALGNYFDPDDPNAVDDPTTAFNPLVDGFFNPFGDGSHSNPAVVAALLHPITAESVWQTFDANASLEGSIFELHGGMARLAAGLEYKQDKGEAEKDVESPLGALPSTSQSSKAAFVELSVPLVGDANARPGLRQLRLSMAERYEDFGASGHSLNPKLGMTWKFLSSLTVRGSWGRSFKIPTMVDRDTTLHSLTVATGVIPDPQSPTGTSREISLGGVNPDLHEQKARSWTAGLDFRPSAIPSLGLSITYYDTEYTDKIGNASATADILSPENENAFQDVIERDPSPEEVAAWCAAAVRRANQCNDPAFPATVKVILDSRTRNIALQLNRGLDALLQKSFNLPRGVLDVDVSANYTFKNETQLAALSPSVNQLDTLFHPVRTRMRASASWEYGRLNVYGAVNRIPSYTDPFGGPNFDTPHTIDSWTTLDLGLAYRATREGSWLDNVGVTVNIVNALGEDPPFVNFLGGFDPLNADPYGRFVSMTISKGWQ